MHGAAQPVAAVSSGRVPTAATIRPKSLSKAVGNGCDADRADEHLQAGIQVTPAATLATRGEDITRLP